MKLPHVNKKTTPEKPNFCSNTVFSLYFKFRAKNNSRRKTTRFFAPFPVSAWPKSLLQFDFKNHENVWTDLKKKTAPQYNSNSLNCKKNQEKANNSPSCRCAAINNNTLIRVLENLSQPGKREGESKVLSSRFPYSNLKTNKKQEYLRQQLLS